MTRLVKIGDPQYNEMAGEIDRLIRDLVKFPDLPVIDVTSRAVLEVCLDHSEEEVRSELADQIHNELQLGQLNSADITKLIDGCVAAAIRCRDAYRTKESVIK